MQLLLSLYGSHSRTVWECLRTCFQNLDKIPSEAVVTNGSQSCLHFRITYQKTLVAGLHARLLDSGSLEVIPGVAFKKKNSYNPIVQRVLREISQLATLSYKYSLRMSIRILKASNRKHCLKLAKTIREFISSPSPKSITQSDFCKGTSRTQPSIWKALPLLL